MKKIKGIGERRYSYKRQHFFMQFILSTQIEETMKNKWKSSDVVVDKIPKITIRRQLIR